MAGRRRPGAEDGQRATPEIADLAIVNANIYTVNPGQPKAKALAVRGGRIIAVGDSVAEYVGPGTRVVDLGGATVIPGEPGLQRS